MPFSPVPDDRRPALQPPRFGLGTLLMSVAVLCAMFAIVHYFGLYGAALSVLFGLSVVAHVVGNALGTKLRDLGDTPLSANGNQSARRPLFHKPTAGDFAPRTRLHQRLALGRSIAVLTTLGVLGGGLFGYFGIAWVADARTGWSAFALGTVACSVLGGIWMFLVTSFLKTTFGEFLHARRESLK